MARRKRRYRKTWTKCKSYSAKSGTIKIGSKSYRLKSAVTGRVQVCPTKNGKHTSYKAVTPSGSFVKLRKVPRRRRRSR